MSYTSIMNQKLSGWCRSLWCKDLIEITLSITTLVGWYKNSFNCGGPASHYYALTSHLTGQRYLINTWETESDGDQVQSSQIQLMVLLKV